ncbi:MAG: galactose-1-phosphate uridylyltransferase [Planctomycetota bacterium]
MPQLRRDPVGGRWVIISEERSTRPGDFSRPGPRRQGGFCPFCEGNEDSTPAEVLAERRDGSRKDEEGWTIRVVPNKYPALRAEGAVEEENGGDIYHTMSGLGHHEVFIEGPRHLLSLSELPIDTVEKLMNAYRSRMKELKEDGRMVYALVFKNVGREAGASLEHSHSQLICTPVVPKRVGEEVDRCEEFYEFHGKCLLCDLAERELEAGERIVVESDNFVVITPYASRFPFEMSLIPRDHLCHYEETSVELMGELAEVLQEAIARLDRVLEDPPYNYVLHTTPFTVGRLKHYHWHIEIIPRLTHVAGFEWGTGFYINPVIPAEAARSLREADLERDKEPKMAMASEL